MKLKLGAERASVVSVGQVVRQIQSANAFDDFTGERLAISALYRIAIDIDVHHVKSS
jgi:hypothetical protein